MMKLSTLLIGKNTLVGSRESDIFQVGTFDGGNAAWSAIVAHFDYGEEVRECHYDVARRDIAVTSCYGGHRHFGWDG